MVASGARVTRPVTFACAIALALVIAALRAATVPAWFADAQYYTQAGRLWQNGVVTFAGHLVGDRHLAILYYQFFQNTLGPSADSAAVALAVAFACAACLVVTNCFLVARGSVGPAVCSSLLITVLAFLPIWNSPLIEPLLLVILLAVIALIELTRRPRWRTLAITAIGVISGLGFGVRPETVVMLIALTLTGLALARVGYRLRLLDIALLWLAFAVSYAAQGALWRSWIPVPKPDTYSAAFVFYLPMYYLGTPNDGPASAALDEMEASAGLPLTTKFIGLFPVMAAGAKAHKVAETDRLVALAGLELIRAHPFRLASQFFSEGVKYFQSPTLSFESHTDSWERRWDDMRVRLRGLDARREEVSAGFGNDAWWRTETLADRRVAFVTQLRAILPSWSGVIRLPGSVLLLGLAATLLVLMRKPEHAVTMVAVSLYVTGVWILSSFSQGFDPRYSEVWRYLALLVVGLTCLAIDPRDQIP